MQKSLNHNLSSESGLSTRLLYLEMHTRPSFPEDYAERVCARDREQDTANIAGGEGGRLSAAFEVLSVPTGYTVIEYVRECFREQGTRTRYLGGARSLGPFVLIGGCTLVPWAWYQAS